MRNRYVGCLQRVGALRFAVIIGPCWVYVINPSLGEAFLSQRFLLELRSLFGLQFWEILTIHNLHKGKVWILDWCYMCKSNIESVDHLLLHCPIVFEMWSMVFTLFGIYWTMLDCG